MPISLPRHAELWFPGYLRNRLANRRLPSAARVWVAITDHWEPYWKRPSDQIAAERVALWVKQWPEIARRHCDFTGRTAAVHVLLPAEDTARRSWMRWRKCNAPASPTSRFTSITTAKASRTSSTA